MNEWSDACTVDSGLKIKLNSWTCWNTT